MNWSLWMCLALSFCLLGRAQSEGEWVQGPGFKSKSLAVRNTGKVGLTLMSPASTGLTFTNELRGDAYLTNAVAHNGSGVALGDVDGDGRVDVYLCNLQGANRLYRNLGEWRFEEVPSMSTACAEEMSTGAAFADIDGDKDLEIKIWTFW
jgi:enediyne biosynthesis protein E4